MLLLNDACNRPKRTKKGVLSAFPLIVPSRSDVTLFSVRADVAARGGQPLSLNPIPRDLDDEFAQTCRDK